jgi:hypothetical protein
MKYNAKKKIWRPKKLNEVVLHLWLGRKRIADHNTTKFAHNFMSLLLPAVFCYKRINFTIFPKISMLI